MNSEMHRRRHGSCNLIRKISEHIHPYISRTIQPCCQRVLLCMVIINMLIDAIRLDVRYLIKF